MEPALPAVRCTQASAEALFDLYLTIRHDEVAAWGWSEAQQVAFLRMQFQAQRQAYAQRFPGADWRVLMCGDLPVGRVVVSRDGGEIRLVDIALRPEMRSRGLGTGLIRQLQAEADRAGKPLRLHVAIGNPALALYRRLGFVPTGEDGVYLAMQWNGSDGRGSE